MAWYKSGSVNVTNGNATVYGNGTLWVDVSILYPGDIWVGPDGRLYEVLSIQSNTQLTLASTYLGATANTQSYAIMPIGLLPSALAQQVKTTLSTANTALSQTVRFDTNQNLTSGQMATARSNIGATTAADVGMGLLSKSVAGGVDVVLSTAEAANLFYEFTGALTANINVVVPVNVRQFFVRNATTGAYTLTVKTPNGTGIKVLQGTRMHLECDGTNVLEPTSDGGVLAVDANNNVAIGTSTPAFAAGYSGMQINGAAAGAQLRITNPTTGASSTDGVALSVDVSNVYLWVYENMPLLFGVNNVEKARFDTSGNLGIGIVPSAWAGVVPRALEMQYGVALASQSNAYSVHLCVNSYNDGAWKYKNGGTASRLAVNPDGLAGMALFTAPSGIAGNPISFTQAVTVDGTGNLLVGVASGSAHLLIKSVAEGTATAYLGGSTATPSLGVVAVSNINWNAGATALFVGKNSSTSRSINAAGTVNASGADYAEYMTKADDCGTLAKGQIVGVDTNGLLTDKWADAVSFMVKSTDPSYVGGDVWGSEAVLGATRPVEPVFVPPVYTGSEKPDDLAEGEASWTERDAALAQYEADQAAYADAVLASRSHFDTVTMPAYQAVLADFEGKLEAARQQVDRIAYCGQIPVNVQGAKPGQYVVPVQDGDGIGGQLVDDDAITFAQYRRAVGVVQNILADGRANIRVKVV